MSTTKAAQHTSLFHLGRCIAHAEEGCKICHAKRLAAAYTPGALEAAKEIIRIAGGFNLEPLAGIIDRNTGCREMLRTLERIANHAIGYGETFDGSPAMGVRPICHECKQKVDLAEAAIQKAQGEK